MKWRSLLLWLGAALFLSSQGAWATTLNPPEGIIAGEGSSGAPPVKMEEFFHAEALFGRLPIDNGLYWQETQTNLSLASGILFQNQGFALFAKGNGESERFSLLDTEALNFPQTTPFQGTRISDLSFDTQITVKAMDSVPFTRERSVFDPITYNRGQGFETVIPPQSEKANDSDYQPVPLNDQVKTLAYFGIPLLLFLAGLFGYIRLPISLLLILLWFIGAETYMFLVHLFQFAFGS